MSDSQILICLVLAVLCEAMLIIYLIEDLLSR